MTLMQTNPSQQTVFPPIAELVPHSGRMLLLDRVVAADADSLQAEVDITAASMFAGEHGVGNWIGIEYMAQAVAAFAGWQAMQHAMAGDAGAGGDANSSIDADAGTSRAPRKIGFLLGSRRYDCESCESCTFRESGLLRGLLPARPHFAHPCSAAAAGR